MCREQVRTYSQRLIKHSHQLPGQESENPHFAVRGDGGHFLAVGGEGQAGGIGFAFGEFIQVSVSLKFPGHSSGELELIGKASPVLQHACFVSGDDDPETRVQTDLGEGGGVHLVKRVERSVVSAAIVHKDLSG